jgi:hypothetical protein
MDVNPNAKMVDIKILEVPYGWFGFVPKSVATKQENHNLIKLIHLPSGTENSIEVPASVRDKEEAAEYRAKTKISFIHELHGESWLNE